MHSTFNDPSKLLELPRRRKNIEVRRCRAKRSQYKRQRCRFSINPPTPLGVIRRVGLLVSSSLPSPRLFQESASSATTLPCRLPPNCQPGPPNCQQTWPNCQHKSPNCQRPRFVKRHPKYVSFTQRNHILVAEKPRVRNFAGGKNPCGLGRPRPGLAKLTVSLERHSC